MEDLQTTYANFSVWVCVYETRKKSEKFAPAGIEESKHAPRELRPWSPMHKRQSRTHKRSVVLYHKTVYSAKNL